MRNCFVNAIHLLVIALILQTCPSTANDCKEPPAHKISIIKVGGSSITDKSKLETLNQTAIEWLAGTLSSRSSRVILVHGAGSFGHFHAKEYGLKSVDNAVGVDDRAVGGIANTRLSVQLLHWHVLSALIDRGKLNAIGISPLASCAVFDGDCLGRRVEDVMSFHDEVIPVIHGDAVLLPREGNMVRAGILGGDKITSIIAKYLSSKNYDVEVLFLTDVDGVFTSDPNLDSSAELVDVIEVSKDGEVEIVTDGEQIVNAGKSSHEHDVTGGLQAKLAEAIEMAMHGVPTTITKCGSISAEQAIRGVHIDRGTVIRLAE